VTSKLYETEIVINDKFHVLHSGAHGDVVCLISDNEAVVMTTQQLKSIYQLVFPDKKEDHGHIHYSGDEK